jgi:hypothetical protein
MQYLRGSGRALSLTPRFQNDVTVKSGNDLMADDGIKKSYFESLGLSPDDDDDRPKRQRRST